MDEYISREEVLSRIYATHSTGGFTNEEAYLWIHDEITNLSAADVQPAKPAHWCINPDGYYPQCSNCGYEPPRELIRRNGDALIFPRYCPECGADTKREVR